jgi:hypothetical protein
MEFDLWAEARDFFYLAFLFFGAAVGFVLDRFRRQSTGRRRSRSLALAYCCFSVVAAALATAFIFSRGAVFLEKSFYLPGGVILILLILAVRFPRVVGFPLILLGGLAVVWLAWSFLRFPSAGVLPAASVAGNGRGRFTIRIASGPGPELTKIIESNDGGESLEFVFNSVGYARQWPVIGGQTRGIVTGISGSEDIYSAPPPPRAPLIGVRHEEARGRTPDMQPGTVLDAYLEGNTLIFR